MSVHINRFVDKLAGAEARNAKDLVLTIAEAKGLHQDVTRLLLALEGHQAGVAARPAEEHIEIRVSGGSFKS